MIRRNGIIDKAPRIRHAPNASDFQYITGWKGITDLLNDLTTLEAFAVFENLMKSKSTINHLLLIAVPILMFGVLGCDTDSVGDSYVPRIRLVKDGPNEFHFQWDEPLKEERIILVRYRPIVAITTTSPTIERYEPSPLFEHILLYFPLDSFISKSVQGGIASIEILSAIERNAFPLPSTALLNPRRLTVPHLLGEPKRILKEHPFKPYRVAKPSSLMFEIPELKN